MNQQIMIKKQRGMTVLSWIIVLALVVFFLLIGIKMIPTYIENYSIQQTLKVMEDDRKLRGMTPNELVDALWDRYRIFTVGVEQGARIAPNVFTRLSDLGLLVEGIKECAAV